MYGVISRSCVAGRAVYVDVLQRYAERERADVKGNPEPYTHRPIPSRFIADCKPAIENRIVVIRVSPHPNPFSKGREIKMNTPSLTVGLLPRTYATARSVRGLL